MSKTFDVICLGRSTLDLFGNEVGSDFSDLSGFQAYVGGSPTNICVASQRLGLNTALVTGVGDDFVRTFLMKFLKKEGVDVNHVFLKSGFHTNTVMVALQPPEAMQFVAYHANNADMELTVQDMISTPLDDTRVVMFTGMCLLKEPSRSATQYAVEYAREHGATIMMDLDYRPPMWPNPQVYGITARVTLPLVDVAIGTEQEVMGAAGVDNLDKAIKRLLGMINQALVVKRGGRGASVYTPDGEVHDLAPFQVEVVNFLGAGDAFAGGFIYGYLNELGWAESTKLGNACGAYIVSQHGTANMMPTLEQIQRFMEAD